MPCRCKKGKGLVAPSAPVETEANYAVVASGMTVGTYSTELEAKAARARRGDGVIRKL